jgi:hypothetical protein
MAWFVTVGHGWRIKENSRTYLNFIKASFQGRLLAVYCGLFLRLGGLDIALLLVKEIIWKVITGFFSGMYRAKS